MINIRYLYERLKNYYNNTNCKNVNIKYDDLNHSILINNKTNIIFLDEEINHKSFKYYLDNVNQIKKLNKINAYIFIGITHHKFKKSELYYFDNENIFVNFVLININQKKNYIYSSMFTPIRYRFKKDLKHIRKCFKGLYKK